MVRIKGIRVSPEPETLALTPNPGVTRGIRVNPRGANLTTKYSGGGEFAEDPLVRAMAWASLGTEVKSEDQYRWVGEKLAQDPLQYWRGLWCMIAWEQRSSYQKTNTSGG